MVEVVTLAFYSTLCSVVAREEKVREAIFATTSIRNHLLCLFYRIFTLSDIRSILP
jgi:hypothetical protein